MIHETLMTPWRFGKSVLLTFLLLVVFPACQGNGTDVGPQLDALPTPKLLGRVLDRARHPIVGARIQIDRKATLTDAYGRFHLEELRPGEHLLALDGSIASTAQGSAGFASLELPVTYDGGRATLPRAIVLDALANGCVQRLPVGVPLAAGTAVTDPATGTRLLLGGTVLSFRDENARAGVTEVDVRLTVIGKDDVPTAVTLDPSLQKTWQNGIVARIEPIDLLMTPTQLVFPNTLTLPNGFPTRGARLAAIDSAWVDLGAAQVGAGSVDLGQVVDRAGAYTFARAVVPDFELTTIAGQVTDPAGVPRGGIVLTAGARSTVSAVDGTFAIENVVATDGTGTPRLITVRAETPVGQRAETVVLEVMPVPGGVTLVGPLRVLGLPTSDVQVLVVYRGRAAEGRRVSVGNAASGAHRAFSDEEGQVIFRDVLRSRRSGGGVHQRDASRPQFSLGERVQFEFFGQVRRRIKLFLGETRLRARKFRGSSSVRVVVAGSSAPIENAFVLAGLDGTRSSRRGLTEFNGTATIDTVQPRPAIVTAGTLTEAPSTDGVHDYVRQISYQTAFGLERRSPVLELDVARDPGLPAPVAPYGAVDGTIFGATDPNGQPPTGQRYEVRPSAHRPALRGELQVGWLGLADGLPLLRSDLPDLGASATFVEPGFTLATELGRVEWLAVERDVDAHGIGPVVRAGLGEPLRVTALANASGQIDLTVPARAPFAMPVVGLDTRLLGQAPEVDFGWFGQDDRALHGGPITDAQWLTLGVLQLRWVDPPAAVIGGRTLLSLAVRGTTTAGAIEQRAIALDPTNDVFTLAEVPNLLVPQPGSPFLPNDEGAMGGLWFQRDPVNVDVSFTRITVSRTRSVPAKGRKILERYVWVVEVSNTPPEGLAPNQVVFPVLPERVRDIDVPVFFFPGAYDVLIENVRAEDHDFGVRSTFRDSLSLAEQDVRAVSRVRTTVIVP